MSEPFSVYLNHLQSFTLPVTMGLLAVLLVIVPISPARFELLRSLLLPLTVGVLLYITKGVLLPLCSIMISLLAIIIEDILGVMIKLVFGNVMSEMLLTWSSLVISTIIFLSTPYISITWSRRYRI